MQKKLLTAAIGAALASPAFVAQADVTVYGVAQVEFAQVANDAYAGTYPGGPGSGQLGSHNNTGILAGTDQAGLLDNKMGRFGIKATEDLGGGLSGIAQMEFQIDTADNQDGAANGTKGTVGSITDRKMFVGIAHKAVGTLRFGQDDGPYKASGVALDPFVATTLEARNNYGMSGNKDGWGVMNGHGGYLQDTMFFDSASFAGAYVNIAVGLEHGANTVCSSLWTTGCQTASGNNAARTAGDLGAVVGWKGALGPVNLSVFGGYNVMGSASTTVQTDDPSAKKIGGQVTFLKTQTISFQYEQTDLAHTNMWAEEADYLFLGYQGKFGPVTAVVQWGQMKADASTAGGTDYEADYLAAGAIYNFSKTFRVFAGYRHTELDSTPPFSTLGPIREETVMTIGMRKDF
jgi:predicted porin